MRCDLPSNQCSVSVKPPPSRVALGRIGERIVADYLFVRGYSILACNLRVKSSEIDLVAKCDGVVSLVEVRVRTRRSFERALASIDARKRERLIVSASRFWRSGLYRERSDRLRIDVAAVSLEGAAPTVEYVTGAVTDLQFSAD